MFRDLFNFQGVNWWTLLGGLGLNFIISIFSAFLGAYLGANEATAGFYGSFGPVLMVVGVFIVCGAAGYITGKIADDVPLKHAVLSSLGAVTPFLVVAVLSFNPIPFMLAGVAFAGAFNGGMLAIPRPPRRPFE